MRCMTVLGSLFYIAVFVPAAASGQVIFNDTVISDQQSSISVTGDALVNVVPDRVVVTLGVETRDTDIKHATEKNVAAIAETRRELQSLGIANKDIQTAHLSIEPERDTYSGKSTIVQYIARNSLAVTLKDPSKIDTVVARALKAGVNNVLGVDFQTSKLKQHRERAREMALLAAREKAEKMAKTLGQSVEQPLRIHEDRAYNYGGYYSGWWGHRGGGMSQNVMQNINAGQGASVDTLALGKISVRASVSVVFMLNNASK
ncbi:MAG: SIMPL domain-containing protein [Gammaproteobacteria bacterium]|nr:SIMPL domain-containing protein [Gammaproteobacteria bacterium]